MGAIVQVCEYRVGGIRFYDITYSNGRTLTCTPSTLSRFAVRFMKEAGYTEDTGTMIVYRKAA